MHKITNHDCYKIKHEANAQTTYLHKECKSVCSLCTVSQHKTWSVDTEHFTRDLTNRGGRKVAAVKRSILSLGVKQ